MCWCRKPLPGLGVVLVAAVIVKWRLRDMPMSVAEKADYLSRRRARMLPALAIIFLSQQASFFSQMSGTGHVSAEKAKISAWLVLSVLLLFGLATKGFWLERKEVRDLIDDENTRANRNEAMRWGFLFAMGSAIAVYILTMSASAPITACFQRCSTPRTRQKWTIGSGSGSNWGLRRPARPSESIPS